MAEAMMRLLFDEPEAGFFIDMPGGVEHAVRPQRDLFVSRLPGEPYALIDQPFADAHPARARLNQQQAQLRHRLRLFDEEHGADDLAAAFGDPAPLALRV